jgi:hypothetical protein
VLAAKDFLLDRQGTIKKRSGIAIPVLLKINYGQVVEAGGNAWVVATEGLLHDRQGPPEEPLGLPIAALGAVKLGEVAQAVAKLRIIGV